MRRRRRRKMSQQAIRHRVALHFESRRLVAAKLRRVGLAIKPQPFWYEFDLLVNGNVRVAVKSAVAYWSRHAVMSRGRRYVYRYLTWHFNFHRHGQLTDRYADFIVCAACASRDSGRRADYFVIPWEAITGKTFAFHRASDPYTGKYAAFRNNWEQLIKAATTPQPATSTAA